MNFTTAYNQNVTLAQLKERKLFYRGLGVDTDTHETTQSMLERSQLDFDVYASGILFKNQKGSLHKSDTKMLSYIDSQGFTKQLGTVSSKWADMMLQPKTVVETFKDFCTYNDLDLQRIGKIEQISKKGDDEYHSKLSMFMVADLSEQFSVRPFSCKPLPVKIMDAKKLLVDTHSLIHKFVLDRTATKSLDKKTYDLLVDIQSNISLAIDELT